MTLSEHNPFAAFGVVEPAIATERTGVKNACGTVHGRKLRAGVKDGKS
jgi:hypothetical protein